MSENLFHKDRNSKMYLHEVYFWTSSIKDWKKLLKPDKYKILIIDNLSILIAKGLITVFAFVIMPNHIHLVWRHNKLNGKEKPHASFNKATAHLLVNDLKMNHPKVLNYFKVKENERSYRIWQRDPLAILLDNRKKMEQKIQYIHENPLQDRWNLATSPEKYKWSSAKFYDTGIDDFSILTDYRSLF